MSKLEQVEKLIHAAKALDGHLDFVFNNAGMGMTIPTEKVTFKSEFIIDLNFMGIVFGTYTAIPIMREQGFGHIVNTASITGRIRFLIKRFMLPAKRSDIHDRKLAV